MSVIYRADGTVIEAETSISINDLPEAILAYMKEHYKEKKIEEAAKILKPNGDINFEAEIAKKDIVFDANGKFIKEVRD
jgi:hypothetical protein